ncbi:hypothetical protein [Amycolatopsis alkalitolerans]|uniref:hypothetical protein n=1 Tax=Amycolatopsis alkalitolerans TaxID=2547244 RepID=UPI001F25D048|nr:hypothetical protein [Amycolatopsis alkalitolerans]
MTEQDTTAIALTAALLTTLRRSGIPPDSTRVVVAGTEKLPTLVPLLMATGIGDITSWNDTDALAFPLAVVTRDATAVIDVARPTSTRTFTPDLPILVPDGIGHLLALPGLLRALRENLGSGFGAAPLHRLDVHHACVQALAALTPIDRALPEPADPDLTTTVARAATRILRLPR